MRSIKSSKRIQNFQISHLMDVYRSYNNKFDYKLIYHNINKKFIVVDLYFRGLNNKRKIVIKNINLKNC
jgi:hypothetical protein